MKGFLILSNNPSFTLVSSTGKVVVYYKQLRKENIAEDVARIVQKETPNIKMSKLLVIVKTNIYPVESSVSIDGAVLIGDEVIPGRVNGVLENIETRCYLSPSDIFQLTQLQHMLEVGELKVINMTTILKYVVKRPSIVIESLGNKIMILYIEAGRIAEMKMCGRDTFMKALKEIKDIYGVQHISSEFQLGEDYNFTEIRNADLATSSDTNGIFSSHLAIVDKALQMEDAFFPIDGESRIVENTEEEQEEFSNDQYEEPVPERKGLFKRLFGRK